MLAVTHTLFTVSVNCEIHLIVVQRGMVFVLSENKHVSRRHQS